MTPVQPKRTLKTKIPNVAEWPRWNAIIVGNVYKTKIAMIAVNPIKISIVKSLLSVS